MTAPRPRRRGDPGYVQLGTFIRAGIKRDVVKATEVEGRCQREIVEEALTDYFRKRPLPTKAPAP